MNNPKLKCLRKRAVKFLFFISFFLLSEAIQAQITFPANGPANNIHTKYALVHVNLHTDYKTLISDATLIVQDEKVVAAGIGITIPSEAVIIDVAGRHIYPGFIDLFSSYGLEHLTVKDAGRDEQTNRNRKGAYSWNDALKSDFHAVNNFVSDDKNAEVLLKNGYTTVLTSSKDGIARGTGALVIVSKTKSTENKQILRPKQASFFSFNKGSSIQSYPASLMGSIALLRQTLSDVKWYAGKPSGFYDINLEELNQQLKLPLIFQAGDKLNILRVAELGKEYNLRFICKGNGKEYQRAAEIAETGQALILPLDFPEAWDLSDPEEVMNLSVAELKHWELAPYNATILDKNGVVFTFTQEGLKDKKLFWNQIRKLNKCGLSEEKILKAMTFTPAQLLNCYDIAGCIKPGMPANFFISSSNLTDENFRIIETWSAGNRYMFENWISSDVIGDYHFELEGRKYLLSITGKGPQPEINLKSDSLKLNCKGNFESGELKFSFNLTEDSVISYRIFKGVFKDSLFTGNLFSPDASKISLNIHRKISNKKAVTDSTKLQELKIPEVWFPSVAFGNTVIPAGEKLIIKHATVWTNEKEGIVNDYDVWIEDGKIKAVGKNLAAPGVKEINAIGMHLTPGIIDEHSHIAVSGDVNEGTQSVSAEVRIGDVIDCDDINIYRQLAGGVTASHILHGSSNTIGGQTQLIKLKWGQAPSNLKFSGSSPFIKFALGENVKQSNWGEKFTTRYPQTRMGVEQTLYDSFTRAVKYQNQKKNQSIINLRKDLELDALSEILENKRFITCHSYEQSEINMLLHVADSFHFKVNTFTHILEGYKVADKLKKHGSNASSFSDWWAYKYEVMEAIPYNGAILNRMGVNTAFNSDDAEMARRLNQEAAKAVKYGNLTEEEAFKFVTLNPAKMLHVDHLTGSVKTGKSADLVLWSENPLSIYSKVLYTFVDGVCYYSAERDEKLREIVRLEKKRILEKMAAEKDKGSSLKKPVTKPKKLKHCEDFNTEYEEE